jgi:tryptophanyl-tRNA synthetase
MRSRVLSGMRPTGALHLGHYHGALKNWVRLQDEHDCFYFVADWHALTTHYEERDVIEKNVYEMVIDWIAAGLDPDKSTIFIQSRLPEHAELFTLLAMGTPLGWLERVPTYKDQIDKLKDRDLATYGFLGYPLLQAADILIYKATYVPVGEDQSVARRAHARSGAPLQPPVRPHGRLRGQGGGGAGKAGQGRPALLREAAQGLRRNRQAEALGKGEALSRGPQVRHRQAGPPTTPRLLLGHLRGSGTRDPRRAAGAAHRGAALPGLDGAKMSKSYGNSIAMREEPAVVRQKVRGMPTDPARVRRTDPGEPEQVPGVAVPQGLQRRHARLGARGMHYGRHRLPGMQATGDRRHRGKEQQPWRERAESYLADPKKVHWIVEMGTERARTVARQTMRDVRVAMGLNY